MEYRAPGDLGAPGCHPSTLIDLANTAMASKRSVKTICMISECYRTHRGVTGPMSFKKSGRFLSENRAPGILEPWLPLNTLIDLANNAPASKRSVKTICFFSEGYRNQRSVFGPMNFKKKPTFFFFRKIVLPGFWGPWLPSKYFNRPFQTLLWPVNFPCSPFAWFQRDTEPMEVSLVR